MGVKIWHRRLWLDLVMVRQIHVARRIVRWWGVWRSRKQVMYISGSSFNWRKRARTTLSTTWSPVSWLSSLPQAFNMMTLTSAVHLSWPKPDRISIKCSRIWVRFYDNLDKNAILSVLRSSSKCLQSTHNQKEIINRMLLALNINPMNEFHFIKQ